MILVTGAAGKTGRAVVEALAARGVGVRGWVRRPVQQAAAREAGAASVIVGDLHDGALWAEALAEVRALYLILPNMSPDELLLGRLAIAAAQAAGGPHLVYHSVLHPQVEAMAHHWQKLRVEEALFEADLPFTILQPAAYMQNILSGWTQITTEGRYRVPYAVETRLSLVDLTDVAAVAATVLTEPGHAGAIYELCGPEALDQREVAALLAAALRRPVAAELVDRAEWATQARAVGLSEYAIETLLAMFRYYERHGFWGNPNVLRWLLGREPTSFRQFVRRQEAG